MRILLYLLYYLNNLSDWLYSAVETPGNDTVKVNQAVTCLSHNVSMILLLV